MGSVLLKTPELALEEKEAKRINDAAVDVMRFYTDAQISPVMQAWLNLAMVAGVVYGPRVIAINMRRKALRAADSKPIPVNQPRPVTPITERPAPNKAQPVQAPPPRAAASQSATITDEMRAWSAHNAQQAAINITE